MLLKIGILIQTICLTVIYSSGEQQLMMHSATQSSTLNYGDSDASNAIDVDGGWADFGAWSECTQPCGRLRGTQTRTRTCTNPPPQHGGADCTGVAAESQTCYTDSCLGENSLIPNS
ncbi:hypothetical protein ACHWQZ_G008430 [Mnemiopsis leidyi]